MYTRFDLLNFIYLFYYIYLSKRTNKEENAKYHKDYQSIKRSNNHIVTACLSIIIKNLSVHFFEIIQHLTKSQKLEINKRWTYNKRPLEKWSYFTCKLSVISPTILKVYQLPHISCLFSNGSMVNFNQQNIGTNALEMEVPKWLIHSNNIIWEGWFWLNIKDLWWENCQKRSYCQICSKLFVIRKENECCDNDCTHANIASMSMLGNSNNINSLENVK